MIFKDRFQAGKKLAQELQKYDEDPHAVVLGLARGGVVVASAIAENLNLPLDVVVVRKVGAPDNEELALGAIADEGKGVFNEELISILGVSGQYLRKEIEKQKEIVKQRKDLYLQGRTSPSLHGKIAIVVDDGIATGASMKVAIEAIKEQKPAKIVLAVPVAAADALQEIGKLVDEVTCLYKPSLFHAVGAFYEHFEQISDEEIIALLSKRKS